MVYPEKMLRNSVQKSTVKPAGAGKHTATALRGYRPGDWKEMYAVDVMCFEPPFRFSQREMRRLAEEHGSLTLLAEAEAELAGFCIVHRDGRWGYVVTLDVAPKWRRQGTAARLLHEAELQLRAGGNTGMGLHVYTGNAGAIRFYERLSYERVGLAEGFYGRGLDALIYRKTW
jgi:[ribosomal protein S18]-alanine N-acetyltransferase